MDTASLPEPFLRFLLAFQRAPLKHPQVGAPGYPLPPELPALLERLGRPNDTRPFSEEAEALRVDAEALRRAALFFVKQALFSDPGDPYRVLGLSADCSPEEIRERYRLLVRIFHPDRLRDAGDWNDRLATRLNDAYNLLKNPARRAELDQRLTSAAAALDRSGALRRGPRPRSIPESSSLRDSIHASRLWRRHPVAVVWGVILITVASVLLIAGGDRLPRLLYHAAPPLSDGGDLVAANDIPVEVHVEHRASPPETPAGGNNPLESNEKATPPKSPSPAPRAEHPAPPTEARSRQSGQPVANEPAAPEPPSPAARAGARDSAAARGGTNASGNPSRNETVVRVGVGSSGSLRTDDPRLTQLMAEFVGAYRKGDLDRFLSLFSPDVRSNYGVGRERLKSGYRRFFADTARRELVLQGLVWEPFGDGVRGWSDVRVSTRRGFGFGPRSDQRGKLSLTVETGEAGRLRISEFYYMVTQ